MTIYEKILKNKDYLETMKEIESIKLITDGKWDWEHGLGHAKRTASYIKNILFQLNADERTIDLGMATALLHDVGLVKGKKDNHAMVSSQIYNQFIENTNITEEENKVLRHAILDHTEGDDINSPIGLALILADKLDSTYHRTENSSIQDKINKEIQKVRKVNLEINDESLILKYTTVNNFDITTFNTYTKAISIPQKIAKYMHKDFIFMINNKIINLKNIYNLS